MIDLKWTGERVVVDKMKNEDPKEDARLKVILKDHLERYEFAKKYCQGKDVLDAACGSGYGSDMMAEIAKYVVGVDMDKDTINYAEANYRRNNVSFYNADLEKDNFPEEWKGEGGVELIVSFETIEHLKDPNLFLSNVSESCNQFIFSIPLNNASSFHKVVYTKQEAKDLILKYFKEVEWFEQDEQGGIRKETEHCRFLIGVAKP